MTIQVFKPLVHQEAIDAVVDVLKSGWIGCGPKTAEFEKRVEEYLQTNNKAVAVMSATDGLQIALKLLGVGSGDEVITTSITFVSTNHVILYEGATPVFADVLKTNGTIDPEEVEKKITGKTKAIMLVHLSGYACDMDKFEKISEKYKIPLIEDCAHAFGGVYWNGKHKGKKIGSSDNICVFSLQAVKNCGVGDAGVVIVPSEDLKSKILKFRWLGIDKDTYNRTATTGQYLWKYDVPFLGIKSNLNDIASAIAIEQLKYLDQENNRRREIARFYKENLSKYSDITLPDIDIETSSCHFYPIYVKNRDAMINHLHASGINPGVHYRRNDTYKVYEKYTTTLPNSQWIEDHTLTLPVHMFLTDEDLETILNVIDIKF